MITPIANLDNTYVRVYNTELKQPICQFTNKVKAANVLGTIRQSIKNTIDRNGKMYCERDQIWLALRLRAKDDSLPTDPSIQEFQKLVRAQRAVNNIA